MNNYYESFYGYTFPESILFGGYTKSTVRRIWIRWFKIKWNEIHSFLELAFKYSPATLEDACTRAIFYDKVSISSVKTILEKKLYNLPLTLETDVDGQIYFDF